MDTKKIVLMMGIVMIMPILNGCIVSTISKMDKKTEENIINYESQIRQLNQTITTLEKSRDYYKNYSFNCYNLSMLKDEKLETEKKNTKILMKESEEKYHSLYEEYWAYNNFTWTGCKDSRNIIKFCKGCNWDLTCDTLSMSPSFTCENSLYFCSANKNEIKIGDVIAFLSPEYTNDNYNTFYTIHRVINIASEGYTTKGDNNIYVDNEIIPYRNVLGKLWKVEG